MLDIKTILKDRGFTKGEIESFLSPEYIDEKAGLYDAKKFKDIDKAIDRIWQAIESNQKIAVYADYDADGIPGAVILYQFFKKINYQDNIIVKIPHRHKDGFGLHKHLIDELHEEGVSLIITIDLGSSNVQEVIHANQKGIDVIITDHHELHDDIPPAYAIINPKQVDCNYVEKNLCGSGVIFKVIHLLLEEARKRKYNIAIGYEKWLLDMVGLATVSDMVPLLGENRVFAYYGMLVLKKNKRKGLQNLLQQLKINPSLIDEQDIGFSVSPCINAASRMNHAMDAFTLLSTENETESMKYATRLIQLNTQRKKTAATLINEVEKKLKDKKIEDIIVIGDENWSPTVLGPVASSLVRQFQMPAFVYGFDGDILFRGSCRSIENVSVVDIMNHMPENFFKESGGHHASGGFAFTKEKENIFEETLKSAYKQSVIDKDKDKDIKNISESVEEKIYKITHDEIDAFLLQELAKMKPFGMKNDNPLCCIQHVSLREIKKFGKQKEHLEFVIHNFENEKGNIEETIPEIFQNAYKYRHVVSSKKLPVRYISFFADIALKNIQTDIFYDIYGRIEESNFLGKKEIRVKVEYIHVSEK